MERRPGGNTTHTNTTVTTHLAHPRPLFSALDTKDGNICISILHPPGEDEMSGERPEERWNPTQTVR